MARPRRSAPIRRIELRMVTDDPLLEELSEEAERRGVELQQHIYDLLRGRYLLRRGESLATLLWLPGGYSAAETTTEMADSGSATMRDPSANAAASAWADLLGTDDA
jgi:hypothetical protein